MPASLRPPTHWRPPARRARWTLPTRFGPRHREGSGARRAPSPTGPKGPRRTTELPASGSASPRSDPARPRKTPGGMSRRARRRGRSRRRSSTLRRPRRRPARAACRWSGEACRCRVPRRSTNRAGRADLQKPTARARRPRRRSASARRRRPARHPPEEPERNHPSEIRRPDAPAPGVLLAGGEHLSVGRPGGTVGRLGRQRRAGRRARDHLDHAGQSRRAVEIGRASAQDFDAVERRPTIRPHEIQPPKGSFSGTPSSRTSAREAPLPPTPRSDAPCVVGFAVRLSDLRKA